MYVAKFSSSRFARRDELKTFMGKQAVKNGNFSHQTSHNKRLRTSKAWEPSIWTSVDCQDVRCIVIKRSCALAPMFPGSRLRHYIHLHVISCAHKKISFVLPFLGIRPATKANRVPQLTAYQCFIGYFLHLQIRTIVLFISYRFLTYFTIWVYVIENLLTWFVILANVHVIGFFLLTCDWNSSFPLSLRFVKTWLQVPIPKWLKAMRSSWKFGKTSGF